MLNVSQGILSSISRFCELGTFNLGCVDLVISYCIFCAIVFIQFLHQFFLIKLIHFMLVHQVVSDGDVVDLKKRKLIDRQ